MSIISKSSLRVLSCQYHDPTLAGVTISPLTSEILDLCGYIVYIFSYIWFPSFKIIFLRLTHAVVWNNQIRSDQSLSRVWLFATPWIAARQASLSVTNSLSSLRLTSIESVIPSSHLILSSPSPPAPNPSQHQSLFQWVNSSHQVAKVLEFQL